MTIEEIKKKARPILKEAGVKRSSIFGSMVRGDATKKSDIDILIEPPKGIGLFRFIGLEQDLQDALGRPVDLVSFKGLKPRIRARVLREQKPIL